MSSLEQLIAAITAWAEQDPEAHHQETAQALLKDLKEGNQEGIRRSQEMFGARLAFGTAGIRGPMRLGPSGMNRLVIAQTSAGLARYLLERSKDTTSPRPQVAIGYDGRHNSWVFARDTAEVLSGHGVEALLLPRLLPTPVLAFALRDLNADAGVMVTASHNPANDNGYKVYLGGDDGGSQIIPPVDRDIEAHIHSVASGTQWVDIPRSEDLVSIVESDIVERYIQATRNSLALSSPGSTAVSVVYTAMHGVGGETFLAALKATGMAKPHLVEKQFAPDPDFPTVAFPNPEEKGALDLSFQTAREVSADLIIAHDPDADRLAVAIPDPSASEGYRALTGNQVGSILGWHLGKQAQASGMTGALANSLVSSPELGKIADHCGLRHEETLTGFKYVSRVNELIFGFEEALGYLVTPDVVRDKDGISAGLLMVAIANNLAQEGRNIQDYLEEIENTIGGSASSQITIRLDPGVSGSSITQTLREQNLQTIGSRAIVHFDDFLDGVGSFPPEDIVRYFLDDGTRVIARPSGTEPKVKIYLDAEGKTAAEATKTLKNVESDIEKLVGSF